MNTDGDEWATIMKGEFNMRNKLFGLLSGIIFICIVITGVILFGGDGKIKRIEFPAISGNLPHDVNFTLSPDIDFSDDKLNVDSQGLYEKVYPLCLKAKSKEEQVERLKKIFDLSTSQRTDMGEVITFHNENSSLDINENGTFSYSRKNINNSKAITLSDKDCISIAEKFLEDNKLLPNGFFENGVGHVTKTSVKDPTDTTIIKKDVYFNRKIDGKKVYGVSRIIVSIGAGAQIDSVYSLYRDIDGDPASIKIKSFQEAFSDLKQLKGTVRIGESAKTVAIKKVELVYWEDSTPYSEQSHIQPVYHFTGEAIDDQGNKDETFEAFIPAIPDSLTSEIKNSHEKSIPSDKKPVKSQSKPNNANMPKKGI